MTVLPKDPVILLSYINTQLRDFYPSLDELCSSLNANKHSATPSLRLIIIMMKHPINLFKAISFKQS